jgi:hypothetical protein
MAKDTAAPARNFTIPIEAKVRAAGGPPPYAARKRRIEDLEAELVLAMREVALAKGDLVEARRAIDAKPAFAKQAKQLAALVDAHNRYYPIEANLPIDPKTGGLLERGRLWRPLPMPTLDDLFVRATALSE